MVIISSPVIVCSTFFEFIVVASVLGEELVDEI